jgi:hypothetical protein
MGPNTGLDDVGRRKIFLLPGLKLRPLGLQPVASRYTDYVIPALYNEVVLEQIKMKIRYAII